MIFQFFILLFPFQITQMNVVTVSFNKIIAVFFLNLLS
ncbi:Uncharacterised protein [Mycobacterium tuberculosis]|nr:Uncharacterised protein [Mycobacterium tuberculosis]